MTKSVTKLIVAAAAIAIGISLSFIGVYQAQVAHNPTHVHTKRTG